MTPVASSENAAAVSYGYSRLCFKAAVIEPLSLETTFEVITPEGIFRMTKADFYKDFPNVVQSDSYRLRPCLDLARATNLSLG